MCSTNRKTPKEYLKVAQSDKHGVYRVAEYCETLQTTFPELLFCCGIHEEMQGEWTTREEIMALYSQ